MATEAPTPLPGALYRRGRLITPLARWLSIAFAFVALAAFWNAPQTRPWPAFACAATYTVWNVLSQFWLQKRWRGRRAVKVAHDAADSVALGVGAAFSGGLASPVWLLYYPHVVGVSVRGGLRYALAFGFCAALQVTALAVASDQPLGVLNALALLFCAFMGGATSSYLQKVQDRLEQVNADLSATNARLSQTIDAQAESQRDQAEALDQLRESEERYRRLLGRIQDGVVIIQDGRLAYANEVMGGILGADPAQLVGVDFREVIDPEDRREVDDRYRAWEQSEAVAGGLEARIRSRQGDLKRVHVRAGSLLFEGKRSVIATVRDVTRERQMEREIKDHAERLAAINEIAGAVNQSLTVEDIFSVAAQEARRIVPFDRLSIALTNADPADGSLELVAVGRGSRRERAPFGARDVAWAFERPTAWCEGRDGEAPPFATALFRASPTRALATVPLRSADRVIGALSLGRSRAEPFSTLDLAVLEPVARHIATALDNARLLEAVRRRNREFESLLEIGRGVLERADLGTLLPLVTRSVNRVMGTRYCLLMLRSGDELHLAAHEGLEPEVERSWQVLRIGESLTGRVVQEGKVLAVTEMRDDPRLMARDRVERYGYRSFLGVPLRRGGEVLGSLEVITKERRAFSAEDQHLMAAFADQAAIAIDNARLLEETRAHLSRIVEANERLEGLDRMRREYLRNVSHEFRTPLTVVRGYSEFLLEDPQSASADVLRVMVESCDRVIDLVDTLMDVSRIEQGEAEGVLQVQDLDLREVASASVELLRAAANKKKVRVELDLPDDGYSLQGDRSLIHQVVRKLVDNAVKYSETGGRVVVRGRAHEREVTLEVEDGGIGIAPEHLSRIFEKFYMVDGGISRRVGGTGVGLYLVREIVRLHQGRVEVDSRPGHGSTFAVRLPRIQHGAALRRAAWA